MALNDTSFLNVGSLHLQANVLLTLPSTPQGLECHSPLILTSHFEQPYLHLVILSTTKTFEGLQRLLFRKTKRSLR